MTQTQYLPFDSFYNSAPPDREELFLLDSLSMDRVFRTLERSDYLFLHYIRRISDERVAEGGEARAYLAELSEQMELSIHRISHAMEHLQTKNYVLWKTDAAQGRTYVELTPRAAELLEKEKRRLACCYAQLSEELGQERLTAVLDTMKRAAELLRAYGEEDGPAETAAFG